MTDEEQAEGTCSACSGHREAVWLRRSKQDSGPQTDVFSEAESC